MQNFQKILEPQEEGQAGLLFLWMCREKNLVSESTSLQFLAEVLKEIRSKMFYMQNHKNLHWGIKDFNKN